MGRSAEDMATQKGPRPRKGRETLVATRRRPRRRKVIGNLLIIAGLLLLAYPVGTWGYTWWQQRALESELERSHPHLAANTASFFASLSQEPAPPEETAAPAPTSGGGESDQPDRAALRAAAEAFKAAAGGKAGPIGKLLIPEIGTDVILMEGTGRTDLREGPGHWPETPLPGMGGNFVVSGHRTTYGAPFLRLDRLEPGDEIDVLLPYAALTYRVTRTMIVQPDEVAVVAPSGADEIFLATCHPIYSARQRLVVRGELTAFQLLQP